MVRSRHQQFQRAPKAARTAPDGTVFDSASELRRWQELLVMQMRGEIRNLRRQVSYQLIYYDDAGTTGIPILTNKTERPRVYTLDFIYEEPQNTSHGSREWLDVFEEYKGIDDPASALRRSTFEGMMKRPPYNKDLNFKIRITGPAKMPKRRKKKTPAA